MPKRYPRDLRDRAVRLVVEQRGQYETEYEAIRSIAARFLARYVHGGIVVAPQSWLSARAWLPRTADPTLQPSNLAPGILALGA